MGLISRPRGYIPYMPSNDELPELVGNVSPRGKSWVSNKTNFLMELYKLMPSAEAYIAKKGYKKPFPDKYTASQINSIIGFNLTSTQRNKFFEAYVQGSSDFKIKGDWERILAVDKEALIEQFGGEGNPEALVKFSQLSQGLEMIAEDTASAAKIREEYFNEFRDLDYEFSPADANVVTRQSETDSRTKNFRTVEGFGVTHTQLAGSEYYGSSVGGILEEDYNFFPAFYNFYHTNEDAEKSINRGVDFQKVDFYESYDEINSTDKKMSNATGDINSSVIPIWSSADGHNRFMSDRSQQDLEFYRNFYPTDYTNQIWGLNPSMAFNGSILDYSSVFNSARSAFFGSYIRDRFGENNAPSFYQLAMDFDAPWNNGNQLRGWWKEAIEGVGGNGVLDVLEEDADNDGVLDDSEDANDNGVLDLSEEQKKAAQYAFYLSVLMLESKRRYNSAMTELFGPQTQFKGSKDYKYRDVANADNPEGYDPFGDTTTDSYMINYFDNFADDDTWAGKLGIGGNITDNKYWRWDESDGYSKAFLKYFIQASHVSSRYTHLFYYGSDGAWEGDNEAKEVSTNQGIINMRDWVMKNMVNHEVMAKETASALLGNITGSSGSKNNYSNQVAECSGEDVSLAAQPSNSWDIYYDVSYNADSKKWEGKKYDFSKIRSAISGHRDNLNAIPLKSYSILSKIDEINNYINSDSSYFFTYGVKYPSGQGGGPAFQGLTNLITESSTEAGNLLSDKGLVSRIKNELFDQTSEFNWMNRNFGYGWTWDKTQGNVVSNVIDANNTKNSISHYYSPVWNMWMYSYNRRTVSKYINYDKWDSSTGYYQTYNNGSYQWVAPEDINSGTYSDRINANLYGNVWMYRLYTAYDESWHRELMELLKFRTVNSIEARNAKSRYDEYRRLKDEDNWAQVMDKRALAKAIRRQKSDRKRAEKASLGKNKNNKRVERKDK